MTKSYQTTEKEQIFRDAYHESIGFLKTLIAGEEYNSIGFLASSVNRENYHRLFTRDAFWVGMAALLSGDRELIDAYDAGLATLRNNQREDGAIASNVSYTGEVSYGIINQRVDPTTLYILGCIERYKLCKDPEFLLEYLPSIKRAFKHLVDTWENKKIGLLYIPRAGNWADEYLQQGYVLYDEALWYLVLREYAEIITNVDRGEAEYYREKAEHVKGVIREKFWVKNLKRRNDGIYRRVFKKFNFKEMGYFLHFYHSKGKTQSTLRKAHGIFDAFGNVLTLLTGVATQQQAKETISFIDEISANKYPLIPAHYPFFSEEIFKSQKLHQYRFKEYVGHYHNGGLWPWYTGLYVAFLQSYGDHEQAMRFLGGILKANKARRNNMSYYEYHVSKRASSELEVRRAEGVDLFLSTRMSKLIEAKRSTVKVQYEKKRINVYNDMNVRSLDIRNGEKIRISAIGPDAEEVLLGICKIEDDRGKCFECQGTNVRGMEPGGAPYLGVSAASFIIGYKAVTENKILFQQ
ncbi:HPr family phosphocarrier protein [Candidatus Omnitrophota bacterium]